MKARIFGVDFETQFLTVALMSAVLILDSSDKVFVCFLCAAFHECGHLLAMMLCSIKPKSIKLRLFDIVIDADIEKSDTCDLFITLSGPVFNLFLAFAFYFIDYSVFIVNILMGLFNLLPVESFDGGHALKLVLFRKLSENTVSVILKVLTFMFLVPLFFCGVLVLFYSKYNYSLLLISMYLVAVLFLK